MKKTLTFLCCICLTFVFFIKSSFAFSSDAKYAVLIDGNSGQVLYEKNADVKMVPSSMSKLMTIYLAFELLKSGDIKLQDKFLVSENAWRKEGSRMFLKPNSYVSVEDLLRGVIVQSGNDASVVLAEGIAGNEQDFVDLMNHKASVLGLKNSHFANATGLPHNQHKMSSKDIATLSMKIQKDFPEFYHHFGQKSFTFNKITQHNRNSLLSKSFGVDGLKTGHTDIAKYGIAVSAIKGDRRLFVVVNGLKNEKLRDDAVAKLLVYGFNSFANIYISPQQVLGEVDVVGGKEKVAKLVSNKEIAITVPRVFKGSNKIQVQHPPKLQAPVDKDTAIGKMTIILYNGQNHEYKLYPFSNIEKSNLIYRLWFRIKGLFSVFSSSKTNNEDKIIYLKA